MALFRRKKKAKSEPPADVADAADAADLESGDGDGDELDGDDEDAEPVYRATDIEVVRATSDRVMVYDRNNRTVHELTPFASNTLNRCAQFAPLHDHAIAVAELMRLTEAQFPSVVAQLERLTEAELIVSDADVRRWVDEASEPGLGPPPPLRTVGVITCDRIDTARAYLTSFAANARAHDRTIDLVVCDDSKAAETREDYRAMCAEVAAETGAPVVYAGLEQKRAFIDALAGEGIDPALMEYAFFDPVGYKRTAGANRNALLLHAVGEAFYSGDDDTTARLARVPTPQSGLGLSGIDPTEYWLYRTRDEVMRAAAFEDVDVLGAHELLLGKTVHQCRASVDGRLDVADVHTKTVLDMVRGGRVILTATGLAGDSGQGVNTYYLARGGATRDRLIDGDVPYEEIVRSREVLRAALRPTITSSSHIMGPSVGFDNRQALPPFVPVSAAEDAAFGVAARRVWRHGMIGHLPWGIAHEPDPPRAPFGRDTAWEHSGRLTSHAALMITLDTFEGNRWLGPSERMRDLGRHLSDFASLPVTELREAIQLLHLESLSRRIDARERLLAEYGEEPEAWAQDVRNAIEAMVQVFDDPTGIAPADFIKLGGVDQSWEALRALIGGYGRLLVAWPAVFDAALHLRERGVRLGASVTASP